MRRPDRRRWQNRRRYRAGTRYAVSETFPIGKVGDGERDNSIITEENRRRDRVNPDYCGRPKA
jgi:hypothetical protein